MSSLVSILILEDDAVLREVLHEVLSSQGYEVVAAARGEEALVRARGEHFDIIIADIRMEGMSGLDAIEQAQQLQPGIGSIVVSGFASEAETLRAVKLNVMGYLKKPFSIDSLLDLINKHLAKKRQELRRDQQLRRFQEALLWSLEEQGKWAEKSYPGQVLRAPALGSRLLNKMGFSGDLPRQLYLGLLLRRVAELGDGEMPPYVLDSLSGCALLTETATEEVLSEAAALALSVCQGLQAEEPLPGPEELPDEVSLSLKKAYSEAASGQGVSLERRDYSGLFNLARTLEHARDWKGAETAYREVIDREGISPQAARALLGLARTLLASGDIRTVEQTIGKILEMTRHLGPVSHALSELETGLLLKRVGHPSAPKLLLRAVESLEKVGLSFPLAQARLAHLSLAVEEYEPEVGEQILRVLAAEDFRFELLENSHEIVPDLFKVAGDTQCPRALELIRLFLDDYPAQIAASLAEDKLDLRAKTVLLELLGSMSCALPASLLAQLIADPEPKLRESALRLKDRQGQEEPTSILKVYSCGLLELSVGETKLDERKLKTQKVRHLLARMLGSFPKPLSIDRLQDEFWPRANEKAKNNLNTAVSLIRQFFRDSYPNLDPVLRTVDTVGLNPELSIWHDVEELERAVAKGRHAAAVGQLETAFSCYRRVARLYSSPYLENCYMDWALERRTRLELSVGQAIHQLMNYLLAQHQYSQAAEYALQLLSIQPDNPEAHNVLMLAQMGLGQPERAVQHFESYQRQRQLEGECDEATTELLKTYHMARYGIDGNPIFDPDSY